MKISLPTGDVNKKKYYYFNQSKGQQHFSQSERNQLNNANNQT
jgi:hypothetical protein